MKPWATSWLPDGSGASSTGVLEDLKGRIPETLPQAICRRLDLPSREEALRWAHFPEAGTPMSQLQSWATPAQKRLIFEELFFLELGLELKRKKFRQRQGIPFETNAEVRSALRQVLPFHPTKAQKTALGEIVADMRAPEPMRRLLQGDVGSGKTIVALQAMLVAIENGYQAALMAPTEILATQHFLGARKLLERSQQRYKVVLLTGSLDEDRKRANRGLIARGEAQLVIGTHALIEERVDFAKLGLVVVDEQHRFGVLQRFRLMKKPNAGEPDVLVMTATPIPRTLALSLYGDLDLSVLDELPPGRTPILTRQVSDDMAGEVWDPGAGTSADGTPGVRGLSRHRRRERRSAGIGFCCRRGEEAARRIAPSLGRPWPLVISKSFAPSLTQGRDRHVSGVESRRAAGLAPGFAAWADGRG